MFLPIAKRDIWLFYLPAVCVLIVICLGEFVFWASVFDVLYASCTLRGTYLLQLGRLSSLALFNVFSITLTSICFLFIFFSSILRFSLFLVSQICWMFCTYIFFRFNILFGHSISFFSTCIKCVRVSLPCFCVLSVRLAFKLLFEFMHFSFPVLPHFGFSLLISFHLYILNSFLYLIPLCVFIYFINEFIHLLFKNLIYLLKLFWSPLLMFQGRF